MVKKENVEERSRSKKEKQHNECKDIHKLLTMCRFNDLYFFL